MPLSVDRGFIGQKVCKAKLMNILEIKLVSLALDYKAILFYSMCITFVR